MKKTVIFLMMLFSFALANNDAKSGDASFVVEEWKWVKIENPNGVKEGVYYKERGSSCGIERGNKLTLLGIRNNEYLVKYTKPVQLNSYGTPCLNNTVFFLKKEEWKSQKDAKKILDKIKSEDELKALWIKNLMNKY